MRVLVYDSNPAAIDAVAGSGIVGAELRQVLAEADFLSLHLPLTAETRGFIGESILRQMKSTAYVINTARGGLVDTDALARALREGWIAGAALDVLPREPPATDDPLLDLDNIVLTPHVAFYSEESLQALRQRTARAVVDALAGRAPEHVWNSEALARLASTR
jgi:D-3-phosphoglycerate dehydrogenase / 2-oxoglutarate reductase